MRPSVALAQKRAAHYAALTDPEDAKKKKKEDEDEDEDEGSETSSIRPRNLSYSSQSERGPKSPAKRKKKRFQI